MGNFEFENQVKEIIIDKGKLSVKASDIKPGMSLNKGEIAMDSVQLLEILVAVEQEFGVMFKDTDITPQIFDSVDNFMEFIHGTIAKKEVQ